MLPRVQRATPVYITSISNKQGWPDNRSGNHARSARLYPTAKIGVKRLGARVTGPYRSALSKM
jgi:hypothetical protein